MMKFALSLFFIVLSPGFMNVATAQTINRVAAIVNSEIITSYQVEQEVGALLSQQLSDSDVETSALSEQALEKLINDKLLAQRIKQLGLHVSDQEINAAVNDVKTNNRLNQAELEAALNAQGLTLDSYREQIRTEILRYKLLAQEVNYKVAVTSSEVRDYFNANIDLYDVQTHLHVSRISFPLSATQRDEVHERALDSRQRLLAGEEFSAVLNAAGDHASGGIMGELTLAELAGPLQQALRDLQSGEISEPIELNQQLHLFIVTDRRSGEENTFERVRKSIEERLKQQKTEQRLVEWERELRANAYIEKRL